MSAACQFRNWDLQIVNRNDRYLEQMDRTPLKPSLYVFIPRLRSLVL